ncbi:MAG: hypothetical protein IJH44_03435 [Solobacterium sp.]|nr:hypothetical protein [Solobacterium sp.]
MILLFSDMNYDREWAAGLLAETFSYMQTAAVLPLVHEEGWASDAVMHGDLLAEEENLYRLQRPLRAYGMKPENIRILNQNGLEPEIFARVLQHSDVLVLSARSASEACRILEDRGLDSLIRRYHGLLVGIGAGAEALLDTVEDSWYGVEREGLGVLSGFHLMMNYSEEPEQLAQIIRYLETGDESVVIVPAQGGVLFDYGNIELLGNAFIADGRDLDELYSLYGG